MADRLTKAFIIVAGAGVADAVYHAYDEITHYSAPGTACYLNDLWSCERVFESGYTKFLGVSLWVYGVVWFPLILAVGVWRWGKRGGLDGGVILLLPLLAVGNLFTLYLWFLELDVIRAICPVCVSMYALNYALTAIAVAKAMRSAGPAIDPIPP